MKTLAAILFAGVFSATAAFPGALSRPAEAASKTTAQLPFRPDAKRPAGTATRSHAQTATIATPTLPFGPRLKQLGVRPQSAPNRIEASNRK